MADGFIKVAPDSTGKALQTFENTVSGEDVHAEGVALVDQFGKTLRTFAVHGTISGDSTLVVEIVGLSGEPVGIRSGAVPNDGLLRTRCEGEDLLGNHNIIRVGSDGSQLVYFEEGPESIAKAEDSASADDDVGVPAMAIRKATPANTSDTDGDYEMLQMSEGRLHVRDLDLGAKADSPASDDTGTWSLIALFKRLLGKLPASLGGKTAAASFSVTTATDDPELTLIGSVTETAPATDTASSGLNGRLQRIAQRITSLIAIVATKVGATNLATSQVTSTGTAATLAAARATRRSILFTNLSSSGSVYIGPATVTTGNGQKLGPGQSCPFTWVGLFQVIDDGATHCVVNVADEYD